ncbi:MAG: dihydroorotase [Campylobacteraceae bacterium]|jgi:dihydroorotase|nr:dihydroorotase [Campylobacteraceae bacterium]
MRLILNSPLDMHLHLRDGDMLKNVAKFSAKDFAGALIMPNLLPPITDIKSLLAYKKRIFEAVREENFTPHMTLFFKSDYTADFLEKAKPYIAAIKLYPNGVTTNSEGGIEQIDTKRLSPVFEAMSELDIPLCVHGETNGFVMDREREFCAIYEQLAASFPKLTIIMEHITTKECVKLLEKHENLHATITLHHLLITLDDVMGGLLNPHLFCKPIAKRYEDKEALLEAALNAHKKVMFGSDSAPHLVSKKECCGCAAGIFSAPIALSALAELFEKHGKLTNLQTFVSDNARDIYKLIPINKPIVLEKKEWIVPAKFDDVVPMFASQTLKWKVKSRLN